MNKEEFIKLSKVDAIKYILCHYDYKEVNDTLELALLEDLDGERRMPTCKPFMYVINMFAQEQSLKEYLWNMIVNNLKQK